KEGLMLIVTYPPGSADEIHRHDAHAFVYVLEGSVVMQLKGGPEVTLKPGETFYEGPQDIHIVGRNASTTKPAKFVVLLIKNQGVPAVLPVKCGIVGKIGGIGGCGSRRSRVGCAMRRRAHDAAAWV